MHRLFQKPNGFQDILNLIGVTSSGRKLISRLFMLLQNNKVELLSYPNELRTKLQATLSDSSPHPLGAAFVTDGVSGRIYCDLQESLGILAPLIYHEAVHSLDETLWRAAAQPLPMTQLREVIFLAECRAYSAQYEFQEELKQKYPALDRLYSLYVDSFPGLSRRLEPSEIAELYKNNTKIHFIQHS